MRHIIGCLTLTVGFAVGLIGPIDANGVASAGVEVIADRPAATLLLPNFQVDMSDPNGVTTLFSVNNASATAVLAHVTLWSDLAVPVLNFNVYLTGFDVQTINLRDVLNGILPRTASVGQDPGNAISPQGPFSQDINFASCTGILPYPVGGIPAAQSAYVRAALTGQASSFLGPSQCFGLNFGDNKARGFVTVDTVNNCTLRNPNQVGYFGGDVTDQNVLYGDYFQINRSRNVARGDSLVHIIASATDPLTSTAGEYTFYGRLVSWTATDHRQPLATNFFARYNIGGSFNGGTVLGVWRDPKVDQQPFTCGVLPAWYPLGQEDIGIFDEQEQVSQPPVCTVGPCPPGPNLAPFGAATQRVQVGGATLPTPFSFGTIFLNLNHAFSTPPGNPPVDPDAAQAWVEISSTANDRFGAGFRAIQLDSASDANHMVLP